MKRRILVKSMAIFAVGFFIFISIIIPGHLIAQESKDDASCWCCSKGEVQEMKAAECREKDGKCFSTKDEAMKHCGQGKCWCCIQKKASMGRPGLIKKMSAAVCEQKGGRCYPTETEAESFCR